MNSRRSERRTGRGTNKRRCTQTDFAGVSVFQRTWREPEPAPAAPGPIRTNRRRTAPPDAGRGPCRSRRRGHRPGSTCHSPSRCVPDDWDSREISSPRTHLLSQGYVESQIFLQQPAARLDGNQACRGIRCGGQTFPSRASVLPLWQLPHEALFDPQAIQRAHDLAATMGMDGVQRRRPFTVKPNSLARPPDALLRSSISPASVSLRSIRLTLDLSRPKTSASLPRLQHTEAFAAFRDEAYAVPGAGKNSI
jgi:hypothetical protein